MAHLEFSEQDDVNFIPPPSAPIFRPTEEEFLDPIKYISKIEPIAEKYGICKIIPPKSFKPPFAADYETFKFHPRIQFLSTLEANSRMKYFMNEKLRKFWHLFIPDYDWQIPIIEGKTIDFFNIFNAVEECGGYPLVEKKTKWNSVAINLGFPSNTRLAAIKLIRDEYVNTIRPFMACMKAISHSDANIFLGDESQKIRRQGEKSREKRGKKANKEDPSVALKLRDRGQKRSIEENVVKEGEIDEDNLPLAQRMKRNRRKKINLPASYKEEILCHICFEEREEETTQCTFCSLYFHHFCIGVSREDYPTNRNIWLCVNCMEANMKSNDTELDLQHYGFDNTQGEFNLNRLNTISNNFKKLLFNVPDASLVSTEECEQKFWEIVAWKSSAKMYTCTVLYGADIRRENGSSGFPIESDRSKLTEEQANYINHPWNLNVLPILPGSVSEHIPGNISGVKIPWKYAGACFSAFCWHNEDHWSGSINYCHFGAPKTWYGVPGSSADAFEDAFRKICPALFRANSDILHHITTHLNPNLLQDEGVPVYRTDQCAGEFVVTFPRAYHAGFNQGYNFAEAVNFCLDTWIAWGRKSVSHYAEHKRLNVFSHDEIILQCAKKAPILPMNVKRALYNDLLAMMGKLKQFEQNMKDINERNMVLMEARADDERQCDTCYTTCYLAGVYCECDSAIVPTEYSPGQMSMSARMMTSKDFVAKRPDDKEKMKRFACPDHLCSVCSVDDQTVLYRHTTETLGKIVEELHDSIVKENLVLKGEEKDFNGVKLENLSVESQGFYGQNETNASGNKWFSNVPSIEGHDADDDNCQRIVSDIKVPNQINEPRIEECLINRLVQPSL